jgi:flavodoxin
MLFSLSSSYAGFACGIRQSIDTYNEKKATNFFDWLVCSMKSVNEILEGRSIEFEDTYIYPNPLNKTTINFKNFNLLISHHDIDIFNNDNKHEITETYNRRYVRLLETLKTENNIYFIRYCHDESNLEEEEIHKFYENINKINEDLKFSFILMGGNAGIKISEQLINKNNFHYFNLKKFEHADDIIEEFEWHKLMKAYKKFLKI